MRSSPRGCGNAAHKRAEWEAFKAERFATPRSSTRSGGRGADPAGGDQTASWRRPRGWVDAFFDAGDVQANGFQIAVDETPGATITGRRRLLHGLRDQRRAGHRTWHGAVRAVALTGDGSFTMNPAVLIDGVEHGATGVIVVFDNRRMGAIARPAEGPVRGDARDQRLGGGRLRGLGGVR